MNSRSFQIFIALSIPIIVIISVLLLISFEKKTVESPEGNFPYMLWSNTPKSCISNTYSIAISVDTQLAVVDSEDFQGIVILANTQEGPLPIFIPNSLGINVHPRQKFNAIVKVNNNGSLEAKDLIKF